MRRTRSPHRSVPRRRLVPVLLAGTLLMAACGGDDESGASEASADAATAEAAPTDGPVALTGVQVDLVGPDVVAEAEIATNQLPSVVLDDISTGRKVNFRNLVPQDKPILLWMYAPH